MRYVKILCLIFLFAASAFARPISRITGNWNYGNVSAPNKISSNIIIQQVGLAASNISNFFYNSGIFNQDRRTTNTPGFEWPKGSGHDACFSAGLSIGTMIDGILKEASCLYKGEYEPGYINIVNNAPFAATNSDFKIYKVYLHDNANTNPDYANWYKMIPYGAPYTDVNHNGVYDQNIDIPGVENATITLFACMTDGFLENHQAAEGFGGGTPPIYCEMHFTAWAYNTAALGDVEFIKWVLINKSMKAWEGTYMAITADPDLGYANDDYIGCDTVLNLAYAYNGDNDDSGNIYGYGANPPAFGIEYLRSPVNHSVIPNNALGVTGFDFSQGSGPVPCETDPNPDVLGAYYFLKGFKRDGTPWVNPQTGRATKICYPGDPETNSGWTEKGGSVQNCNGSLTGTIVAVNPVGERRFIFSSGAENFIMVPNDTQTVVVAQMMARGSNNFNSVTKLKQLGNRIQNIYDANFNNNYTVFGPPPQPVVTVSSDTVGNSAALDFTPKGTYNLDLSWNDIAESYKVQDTLFSKISDSSFYKFEGYEIYQVSTQLTQLPDFSRPETIDPSLISLIAIYDKKDSVGVVVDSFSTGIISPSGFENFATFQIIPPYRFALPTGFPNTGLSRSIHLSATRFAAENGGKSNFIYGHDYKFLVIAYAYNTHPFRGEKIFRAPLQNSLITVRRDAPLAGVVPSYDYGDTLFTGKHDLGVIPIVMIPDSVRNAKYKVVFRSANYVTGLTDTVYNVLRSLNNGTSYDTLKRNLKPNTVKFPTSEDSSRIIDGILLKVDKIRYTGTSSNSYDGNIGVIKDILHSDGTPDSAVDIQSRLPHGGWDYSPAGHQNLTGSKFSPITVPKPYQSYSMSVTYPFAKAYSGLGTTVPPGRLRKVKIIFKDITSGQQAYRYLATTSSSYIFQEMKPVPFQVFEIEEGDSSAAPRQLNCAFLEFPAASGGNPDGIWTPISDTTGGKEVLYIFNSNYSSSPNTFYTTKNLFSGQGTFDIQYIWAPKLISSTSPAFQTGDEFTIYPYSLTNPNFDGVDHPLIYEFETTARTIVTGPTVKENVLSRINVVPNPFYGFNSTGSITNDRFVTFRRLPQNVTIKIYGLNGDLIRTLTKSDDESTLVWDLRNSSSVQIASGIYLALVDASGYGQKVVKLAVFTQEER